MAHAGLNSRSEFNRGSHFKASRSCLHAACAAAATTGSVLRRLASTSPDAPTTFRRQPPAKLARGVMCLLDFQAIAQGGEPEYRGNNNIKGHRAQDRAQLQLLRVHSINCRALGMQAVHAQHQQSTCSNPRPSRGPVLQVHSINCCHAMHIENVEADAQPLAGTLTLWLTASCQHHACLKQRLPNLCQYSIR